MEGRRIAIVLIQNVSKETWNSACSGLEQTNAIIKGGNTTILLRRGDADFFKSILGIVRAEKAAGVPVKQTNLEDLYYNVNIDGKYEKLFLKCLPRSLSNDPANEAFFKKYSIPHKICSSDINDALTDLLKEDPELILYHLNGEISSEKITLELLETSLKLLSSTRRIYFGLYPIIIPDKKIVEPSSEDPLIQSLIPPQSYCFYKSDPISDTVLTEGILMVESDKENCRVDTVESITHLVNFERPFAGRHMLAEQFMRQVAYYLGCTSKFGA